MVRRKQLTVPQNSSFLKIDSPPQGQGSRSELCSTGSSRSITKSFFTPCSICEEKLGTLFLDKIKNLSLQGLSSDKRSVGLHFTSEGSATFHWSGVAVEVLQSYSSIFLPDFTFRREQMWAVNVNKPDPSRRKTFLSSLLAGRSTHSASNQTSSPLP